MEFIYIIKPKKENFNETGTEEEFNIMGEHFLYLKQLIKDNILILAGPELNAKFGIAVIEAENEEEAKKIMYSDPAVKKGVMNVELYPFRVSLLRGREDLQ
jgi:uncharacterized protein YciI